MWPQLGLMLLDRMTRISIITNKRALEDMVSKILYADAHHQRIASLQHQADMPCP